MKKFLTIVLAVLFVAGGVTAQNTLAAVPPSFQFKNSLVQQVNVRKAVMTADVEQLRKEDMERMKDGHPMRVAVGVPVDIELKNAGSDWLSLPDGTKIWQQAVRSEGAHGLILSFDELYIPEGGELFVYTADRRQVQRFDHTTNPDGGAYATDRLYQDEIVLEYVQSAVSDEAPRIKVSDVGYVYRAAGTYRNDLACFIDIHCEEGVDWQAQTRGVVGLWMYLPSGSDGAGWYICSGSLVNNTRQDGTPYILTAHHCFEGADEKTYPKVKFDFFKESTKTTGCFDQSEESESTRTLIGCELLADIPLRRASDGTLLKLTQDIPEDWNVYYNGWDASGVAATSGVCIHHPYGIVKKISTYTQALKSISSVNMGGGDITGIHTHWDVHWAETVNGRSVTYEGSSGSPLFNQNGLIVGTLTGGDSECGSDYGSDIYGKFSYHFDGHPDSELHFKNYLDPDNTGVLELEGYAPKVMSLNKTQESRPRQDVFVNDESIVIRSDTAQDTTIGLYDLTGALVWSQSMSGYELCLPKAGFAKGVYLVKAGNDTHKIIVN